MSFNKDTYGLEMQLSREEGMVKQYHDKSEKLTILAKTVAKEVRDDAARMEAKSKEHEARAADLRAKIAAVELSGKRDELARVEARLAEERVKPTTEDRARQLQEEIAALEG